MRQVDQKSNDIIEYFVLFQIRQSDKRRRTNTVKVNQIIDRERILFEKLFVMEWNQI